MKRDRGSSLSVQRVELSLDVMVESASDTVGIGEEACFGDVQVGAPSSGGSNASRRLAFRHCDLKV